MYRLQALKKDKATAANSLIEYLNWIKKPARPPVASFGEIYCKCWSCGYLDYVHCRPGYGLQGTRRLMRVSDSWTCRLWRNNSAYFTTVWLPTTVIFLTAIRYSHRVPKLILLTFSVPNSFVFLNMYLLFIKPRSIRLSIESTLQNQGFITAH